MDNIDDVQIQQVVAGDFKKSADIPDGLYTVEITGIDKVQGKAYMSEKIETQLEFEFTVTQDECSGAKLYRKVSPKWATGENSSNLYKIVSATLGAQTTPVDFHVSSLKGLSLKVFVKRMQGKKGMYTKVEDWLPDKKAVVATPPAAPSAQPVKTPAVQVDPVPEDELGKEAEQALEDSTPVKEE